MNKYKHVYFSICLCMHFVCVCACVFVCVCDTATTGNLWWKYSKAIVDLHRGCTPILITHALSHCYMYSHCLVIFHTKMQTHICTQTHTVPCTRWRGTTTQRDSGNPDAHVCAWTSGGFYGSTLSSCYCANHPLVHSSEFKSSRVHRKNKICSPFSQVVNYAYKPNIHI